MEIKGSSEYLRNQNITTSSARPLNSAISPQEKTATASAAETKPAFSGRALMLSRLFGSENKEPPVQTVLNRETIYMDDRNFLTTDDRNMLSELYEQAYQQGIDLNYVTELADDLGSYRMFHKVQGSANNGYDLEGHKVTYLFTEKDAATAERILNSSSMAGSKLDSGFLRYELYSGYSFNHQAHFDFLEDVVNKFGKGVPFDKKFQTYSPEGQNNFIRDVSKEVICPPIKCDVSRIDDKWVISEQGYKNGWRVVGGELIQVSPENDSVISQWLNIPKNKNNIFGLFFLLQNTRHS